MKWVFILALFTSPAYGQALEIKAGASQLFNADGGSVLLYLTHPDSISEIDAGLFGNRLVFGANVHFEIRHCDVYAGDRNLYLNTLATGVGVAVTGASVTCGNDRSALTAFVGGVGTSQYAPYQYTVTPQRFGAGVLYRRSLSKHLEATGVAVTGSTLLESMRYRSDHLRAEETGGLLAGGRYFEAQAAYEGRHIAANFERIQGYNEPSTISEGLSASLKIASLFGNAFQSGGRFGESLGGSITVGRVSATALELFSTAQRQAVLTANERVFRRWTVNEFVGQGSVSFGGGYRGNLLSFDVGSQLLWVASAGFQRALAVDASLQLPRIRLQVTLDILPGGRILYGAYGDSFITSAFQTNGAQAIAAHTAE